MFIPKNIQVTQPEIHTKGWGEEVWIYNGPEYCGKILKFNKGATCSFHYHEKHESWFIQKGVIELRTVDLETGKDVIHILSAGNVAVIPSFAPHQVFALEDSEVFEISTTHFENGSFRIEGGDSQKVKN